MSSRNAHSASLRGPTPRRDRRAFTLLEVLLAVFVLAMVSLSIYRFVEVSMTAAEVSKLRENDDQVLQNFALWLRSQMASLPGSQPLAIGGEAHRFNGVPTDELRWIAQPGDALLTRHASGLWHATLTARQLPNNDYELGLSRVDSEKKRTPEWLPVLRGVRGFEVRHYDAMRREWLEKWTSPQVRPALIRVKLWRGKQGEPPAEPYEMVIPVAPDPAFAPR